MDEVRRYVNLSFIFAAIVMSWFFVKLSAMVMGWLKILDVRLMGEHVSYSTLIGIALAIVTTIVLWRNAKIYENSLNVAHEMRKVTWPTVDETKYAMKVVVATSIIVACILFCFDIVAQKLTSLIMGIG